VWSCPSTAVSSPSCRAVVLASGLRPGLYSYVANPLPGSPDTRFRCPEAIASGRRIAGTLAHPVSRRGDVETPTEPVRSRASRTRSSSRARAVVAVARATTTASARARSIGRNRIADTIRGDFVGR
jgi:hypothetical protein